MINFLRIQYRLGRISDDDLEYLKTLGKITEDDINEIKGVQHGTSN